MYFQDILEKHNVRFVTDGRYSREGWINFDCPFCDGGSDPDKPYCGYNLSGNYIFCWRCGWHPLDKTVSVLAGVHWKEAKSLVKSLEYDRTQYETIERRGKLVLPEGVGPMKKYHRDYLRSRGFDPHEIAAKWGVQGIHHAPNLSHRLLIPIHYRGEVVSWTTRKLGGKGTRYVSASPGQEIINHKDVLYGADHCGHAAVIVEGPTDAWRVGYGACSVLGTQVKPEQVRRLSNFVVRAVCFDSEQAAQERAKVLVDVLSVFPGETFNIVLDAADPGSATKREIRRLRKEFLE